MGLKKNSIYPKVTKEDMIELRNLADQQRNQKAIEVLKKRDFLKKLLMNN